MRYPDGGRLTAAERARRELVRLAAAEMIDVAPHDDESAAVLATARRRHNRSLTEICRHLEGIGALRDDVDARLASRIITCYYGIDGLLRTRDVFSWSLERSNEWLLAHASAAVLRSPAGP